MRELEEKFFREKVMPYFEIYLEEFESALDANQALLRKKVLEALERLAEKAQKRQQEQQDYKVSYIQFAPLQIGVLQGSYEVVVNAYNSEWYQEEPLWESFSLDYLYKDLEEIKEKLYKECKMYRGKVRPLIIDSCIFEAVKRHTSSYVYFVNKFLKQWDEEQSFKLMPKEDKLIVTWGEYKNQFEIVYAYEGQIKGEQEFKELLEEEQDSLIFSMWHHLKLCNAELKQKSMTSSFLKEAYLERINFEACDLLSINFKKAHFENCHFKYCDLHDSDFTEAEFKKVTFENCNLAGCVFKGAIYQEVDFTDSLMYGTIIEEQDIPKVNLKEEQIQELHKESGSKDVLL